jgi:hypothetical protein
MYYMVLLVVDDLSICPRVLDAWHSAKVPGITILESTGMGRLQKGGLRDDLPMMPSLSDLLRSQEYRHRTIFSVVEGEEMVDRLIQITENVLGDLNDPDTGMLVALPVARAAGIHGASERARGGKATTNS